MKVIRLQVEYEKLFPHDFFDLSKYKKAIQSGLLVKLTNAGFEDDSKVREHIIKFSHILDSI